MGKKGGVKDCQYTSHTARRQIVLPSFHGKDHQWKRLSGLRSPPLFSADVGNEILPQVALTRVRHTSCLDRLRVFFEMGTVDGKVPSFSIVQGKGFLI